MQTRGAPPEPDTASTNWPGRARVIAETSAALLGALVLVVLGHRLFVDATAAVYYNADERIPEAIEGAWLYAAIWGILNAAVGYLAYRAGFLRFRRGVTRVAGASLLVLDLSFLILLGVRGSSSDLWFGIGFSLVIGALGVVAWRRPVLGGSLLFVVGGFLTIGTLFNSATYEGEAAGLLFDEDTFFIFSLGLFPTLSGILSVVAFRYRGR
jgi:hypothetical protein